MGGGRSVTAKGKDHGQTGMGRDDKGDVLAAAIAQVRAVDEMLGV